MAGVAGLEPVTSAVTGQRSNQLSYTPREGERENKKKRHARQVLLCSFLGDFLTRILVPDPIPSLIKSGQQTPRRWGWGTPLKKRTATRIRQCYSPATICQPLN
jgi:hypothetical protein